MKKYKLYYPVDRIERLAGGPKTFMQYFNREIRKYFEVVDNPRIADIVFGLNNWLTNDEVLACRMNNGVFINRVNGVFKPYVKGYENNYASMNESLKWHYDEADGIIYQSYYSKKGYKKYVSKQEHFASKIIFNGVDTNFYNPRKINHSGTKIGIIKKSLLSFEDEAIKILIQHYGADNIVFIEKFSTANELFALLNKCNIVVHLDYQNCMPNLLLEIMACGMPVASIAGGGAKEILPPQSLFCEQTMISVIDDSRNNKWLKEQNREIILNEFKIEDCIMEYADFMKKVYEAKQRGEEDL